jgi:ankyrin repeat protein
MGQINFKVYFFFYNFLPFDSLLGHIPKIEGENMKKFLAIFTIILTTQACAKPSKPISDNIMVNVMNGNLEGVKKCIEKGQSVETRDGAGQTALILAASFRHSDVVEYLVKKGADVNAKTKEGFTALMAAASSEPYKGNYNLDIVEYLIKKGAEVNAKTNDGTTALVWAITSRNIKIVEILVEKGADVNAEYNDLGNKGTALTIAKQFGQKDIIGFLLKHGAREQ